jgi:hypothetical protein
MKTTINGLTENQNTIVNDIISEFKNINDSEKIANLSIIDSIFAEANKDIKAEKTFYSDIIRNNEKVKKLAQALGVALEKKLIDLFNGYPNIQIYKDNNGSCRISFKGSNARGCFWLNVCTVLARNSNTSKNMFSYRDMNDKVMMSKFSECILQINSVKVNLCDFETTDLFKNKLMELITNNPDMMLK